MTKGTSHPQRQGRRDSELWAGWLSLAGSSILDLPSTGLGGEVSRRPYPDSFANSLEGDWKEGEGKSLLTRSVSISLALRQQPQDVSGAL